MGTLLIFVNPQTGMRKSYLLEHGKWVNVTTYRAAAAAVSLLRASFQRAM